MPKRSRQRQKLKDAWHKFIESGVIQKSVVRKEIADSWKRSMAYGINPYSKVLNFSLGLSDQEKKERFARREVLLNLARPFLTDLYWLVESLDIAIFLTDEEGLLLEVIAKDSMWDLCSKTGALPGGSVHEKTIGTTAAGIVISTGKEMQVIEQEHFCLGAHNGFTFAAPIHDHNKKLQGVLEITGISEVALKHPHTFGMTLAAAKAIENRFYFFKESETSFMSKKYLQAVIDQMPKGLLIFDKEGRLTHLNPVALTILNLNEKESAGQSFSELLSSPYLIKLLGSDQDYFQKEAILEGKGRQTRYLVTIQKILDNNGYALGKYMTLEEMKEIKKLVHRMIGATARYQFSNILGHSPAIKEIIHQGLTVAKSISNVLILGESGTGKEMVAQAIHNASQRREGPFVALNCAALPIDLIESELFGYEEGTFTGASRKGRPGKFELADEGTLFLDEIDKMPLEMQVKLLRVLEDRRILRLGGNQYLPVNVRIIAASNVNLKELARKNLFREELYYRLNVLQIHIPPLRERREDIPLLIDFFIKEKSQGLKKKINGIDEKALRYLCSLDWPGNVRQLENYIERAIHFFKGEILCIEDIGGWEDETFPGRFPPSGLEKGQINSGWQGKSLAQGQKEIISTSIRMAGGNLKQAASSLGISRTTLYQKIKKYNIRYQVDVKLE